MNKEFISILIQKIRTGNARLPHLNAIPGRLLKRIDFHSLSLAKDGLPETILDALFKGEEFRIDIDMRIPNIISLDNNQQKLHLMLLKKLKNIQYDNDEAGQEVGIKPFGLGFPILIKRSNQDPTKIIKAPLFIWSIDITKRPDRPNVWTLKNSSYAVIFNDVLLSFLESDQNINLYYLKDKVEQKEVITYQDVVDICQEVITNISGSANNFDKSNTSSFVMPIPAVEEINETTHTPWVSWSGMLGLYKIQKQAISSELTEVLRRIDEFQFDNLPITNFQSSDFAGTRTDPSQQGIISHIEEYPRQIVQGPPGTGKSQSLTATITNALVNGATCLVVCEKKTALNIIRKNLKELGLGELCIMIDDIYSDRERAVRNIRTRLVQHYPEPNVTSLKEATQKSKLLSQDINELHKHLAQPLFKGQTWADIVGTYSRYENIASRTLLDRSSLSKGSFSVSEDEYDEVAQVMDYAEQSYNKTKQLPSILRDLDAHYFQSNNATIAKYEIESSISSLLTECSAVQYQYDAFINKYEGDLKQYYQEYYDTLFADISALLSLTQMMSTRFGSTASFNLLKSRIWLLARGIFVRKFRGFRFEQSHWKSTSYFRFLCFSAFRILFCLLNLKSITDLV